MKPNKKALQEKIRKLTTQLRAIEDKEEEAENSKLVGRCFRYSNSYGSHKPRWWLYSKVLSIDGSQITVLQFEIDCDGGIAVKPETTHFGSGMLIESSEEISENELCKQWGILMNAIQRINVLKP